MFDVWDAYSNNRGRYINDYGSSRIFISLSGKRDGTIRLDGFCVRFWIKLTLPRLLGAVLNAFYNPRAPFVVVITFTFVYIAVLTSLVIGYPERICDNEVYEFTNKIKNRNGNLQISKDKKGFAIMRFMYLRIKLKIETEIYKIWNDKKIKQTRVYSV